MNHETDSKQRARLALGASLALFLVVLAVPAHASTDSMTSLYCLSEAEWDALWDARNAGTAPILELYTEQGVTVPSLANPPHNPAKKCITIEMKGTWTGGENRVQEKFTADRINLAYNATCTFELEDGSKATVSQGTHHTLANHIDGWGFERSWTVPAGCDLHIHARSDTVKSHDYGPNATQTDRRKYWDFGTARPSSCSEY